ncbi:MAG TPA: YkgJ family cysteine cluster protein [Kofleriaceae bacterium]|nr:YkgJ family cysteine cluster protein [Kofleriaceae bacterium]
MSRLGELHAKVDAFFARVRARHGDDMQCHTGCSDCCHVRLTVTSVEAAAIAAEIASWPADRRRALGSGAAAGPADRCAALDEAGRCRIYAARPIVCRSHGVPIRMRRGSLPVIDGVGAGAGAGVEAIEACHRNFTRTEPAADCVLDQTTLSALTLAIDREAGGDGSRTDLAALLAELARADDPAEPAEPAEPAGPAALAAPVRGSDVGPA